METIQRKISYLGTTGQLHLSDGFYPLKEWAVVDIQEFELFPSKRGLRAAEVMTRRYFEGSAVILSSAEPPIAPDHNSKYEILFWEEDLFVILLRIVIVLLYRIQRRDEASETTISFTGEGGLIFQPWSYLENFQKKDIDNG